MPKQIYPSQSPLVEVRIPRPTGTPMMPPIDGGLKKSKTKLDDAVKYAEENQDDFTPITSMAHGILMESPSAPLVTNWLLFLLVMAVERMRIEQRGEDS